MEANDAFLSSKQQASYQTRFREILAMGVENMSMNVYCKSGGGQKQACVFVWKVPTIHSSTHSGKVSATMDTCQEQAPEVIGVEIVNHFNNIMAQISDIPTSVRDTL